MNYGRPDGASIFADIFGVKIFNTLVNQYMLSLGEFDTDNYLDTGDDVIVWLVFIATTFITQITFLNMLIAIMGDTFARVSEAKDQSALSEKIKILSDYVIVVRNSRLDKDKFLFSISPTTLGTDEQSSWEGTVTQLRKAIDNSLKGVQNNLNKKIGAVSQEVTQVNARLQTLDDRISDLSGQQQLLPNADVIERIMKRVIYESKNVNQGGDEDEEVEGQGLNKPLMSEANNFMSRQ